MRRPTAPEAGLGLRKLEAQPAGDFAVVVSMCGMSGMAALDMCMGPVYSTHV